MIDKDLLNELYQKKKLSVAQIADQLRCSQGKVNYWLYRYSIPKRSIAAATYQRLNPDGDPFKEYAADDIEMAFLSGIGLGLYWGEGNKKNKGSVRLGNTDPALVRAFLAFLRKRYRIADERLRFGLQIFSDMDVKEEERFWSEYLGIRPEQFYKTIVTVSGKVGTYREKSKHGVLTLYFHNARLRDLLNAEIDKLRSFDYDSERSA